MVVRARSLAAVFTGLAAFPLAAHAGNLTMTPNISCTSTDGGVVNGIDWGDFGSLGAPLIGLTPQPEPDLPAVQFGCNGSMYSVGIQGSDFAVNFGDIVITKPVDKSTPLLFTSNYKLMIPGTDQWKYFTNFDLYIELFNSDGVLMGKDFVGVKLDSMFGFSSGGDFKLMGDGSVMLDPTIPGGSGVLELYDTPAVPEPATLALVGSGVAAGVLRRKRKARS